MTKFTKERLEEIAELARKATYKPCAMHMTNLLAVCDSEVIEEMARQLLASMEQEPVAYMHHSGQVVTREECCDDKIFAICCKVETPLYAAPQLPQPAPEKIAMQNFRASMEGIGHIRRTLDETFGGLRGTHCEPDVLVECKEICDAIYEAYRKTAPVTPDGWQLVPKEPTEAMNKAGWAAINEHDAINPTYRAMLAAAPQQDVRLALEIGMSRYAGAMQKLVDSGD
ncbi:hypothetical protein [Citrobacter freundii]|uniref:hypothetical protein n=1 Tax=Citrobacter freundii TaxID=546 RepID=UPI00397C2B8B